MIARARPRWSKAERLAASAPWTEAQQRAWSAPIEQTPSDWCDEHRVLAGDGVLEPGRWKTSRTPYLREVLDALDPDGPYREVVFKKSARVGGTEVVNCAISYLSVVAPDPILLVYPVEEKATEEIRDRIEPMLRAQDATSALFTERAWDIKNRRIKLTSCTVRVGWSRSADTLAGFQARYRFFDEVDKYGQPRNEADAISLGDARGMQYGERGKSYKTSTPTTPHGAIHKLWISCPDRRRYHLPCPHCGELQVLVFDRLRWEGHEAWEKLDREAMRALGAAVSVGDLAVSYACVACDEPIFDADKGDMLEAGQWVSEGFAPGERPRSDRVAFHISALYSPWVSWREVVAEALASRAKDAKKWQNFINSWLGEVFEEEATALAPELFLERAAAMHPRGKAPSWTRAIVGGVDVQQDHLWFVVRAAGSEGRRRTLDWGRLESWEELREVLGRSWPVEGLELELDLRALGIDVGGGQKALMGTRTDEAFRFVALDPARVWAVKGLGGDYLPTTAEPFGTAKSGKGKLLGVAVRMLNTQHYKSKISGLVRRTEPVVWEEAPHVTREYARQMAAEHQVWRERREGKVGGQAYLWWQKRAEGTPNHLLDASVYAEAVADILRVDLLRSAVDEDRARLAARRAANAPKPPGWSGVGGNWWSGERGR